MQTTVNCDDKGRELQESSPAICYHYLYYYIVTCRCYHFYDVEFLQSLYISYIFAVHSVNLRPFAM